MKYALWVISGVHLTTSWFFLQCILGTWKMSKLFCNTCNVCIGVCHFVHRSPSLVSFRHSNDERNPPDVTGTPAPVEAPGGRQRLDQNLDVQLVKGVLHESRYQNSHLSRHRPSSSEDALPHAFGRRALWG